MIKCPYLIAALLGSNTVIGFFVSHTVLGGYVNVGGGKGHFA